MDVVIVGAHGQIALALAERLIERGDRVRGVIRNPDHVPELEAAGITPAIIDLEATGAESQLAHASRGADAMVFAAGAGAGSTAERKWTVDFGGVVIATAAAGRAEIDRFVVISAMGTDQPPQDDSIFSQYLQAKARADAHVRGSGLEYTIVRPGALTDDPPTGQARAGRRVPSGEIPRADVAEVVLEVLDQPGTIGRTFEVTSGPVRLRYAISGLVDQYDTIG